MRERVFILSLVRHGFRVATPRQTLKLRRGYVIPSTKREDAQGIDFWVKLPNKTNLIPIQITQRGTRLYKKYRQTSSTDIRVAAERAEERLRRKRERCREQGTAFVLIRDYDGHRLDTNVAWGDKKALFNAVQELQPA
jgi:hypothetical protein